MPFASKAQQRYLFSTHPAIARRFADHTPDMSALPERAKKTKKKDETEKKPEKKAFSERAAEWCFRRGVPPREAARLLEKVAAALEAGARGKGAADESLADLAGRGLGALGGLATNMGLLGTVGVPAAGGLLGGVALGHLRNEADTADAESLRRLALARAYQRRAQELALRRQVNQLQDKHPGRYVVLS